MRQYHFTEKNHDFWQQFEQDLQHLEEKKAIPKASIFARRYRTLCHHLALASERNYSPSLIDYLQQLSERAHSQLYREQKRFWSAFWQWITGGMARSIRAEKTVVIAAHLLFYVPFLLFFLLVLIEPTLLEKVLGSDIGSRAATQYAEMMQQHQEGINRSSEKNILMFGFYVYNNISIAFYSLGGGLLFGLGAIWTMVFNGLVIGGVFGYMLQTDAAPAFFGFVGAHGAFELTGIVLAGAAGLRVGLALINPQGYARLDALRIQGKQAGYLMAAAFALLLIAAIIEAFWSSTTLLPPIIKMMIAVILWCSVYAYFLFAGKETHAG